MLNEAVEPVDAPYRRAEGGVRRHRAPDASRWTVSAVIPTYNRAALVKRAIDSALTQLRPPDEIIVVDDGSTDETPAVVAEYGERVVLVAQSRGGVGNARNLGVARSTSDYVAFLDSDDVWEPAHLLRMARALGDTDGRAVLYFSDAVSGDPRYAGLTYWGLIEFEMSGPYELRPDGGEWFFRPFQPVINPSVALVRRDAYLAVGGSASRLVRRSDTHLMFKLGLAGPVCAVAGAAATVTTDDPASITATIGPEDEKYLGCTIWLYRDLLSRRETTRAQRRVLRQRLADGYWDLAKHHGLGAPARTLAAGARAARYDPVMVPKRVHNRLRRMRLSLVR